MKSLLITLFIAIQLSSCSTSNLQSGRLDSAESYILQAEQRLSTGGNKRVAAENIGTAKAYLGTLRDHKKYLTKGELARYQTLLQRSNKLSKRIR